MRKTECIQLSIFNSIDSKFTPKKNDIKNNAPLDDYTILKLKNYTFDNYCNDVEIHGLKNTWNDICAYILEYGQNDFVNIKNFGQMYEAGLAIRDKHLKKKSGQYYTPNDVAKIMAEWLDGIEAENICDVGCGTGNLILSYFDFIGEERAKSILKNGNLYLYDKDEVALKICKTSILLKFGTDFNESINDYCVDFLDKEIVLPKNCKVISNPPYSSITDISDKWDDTDVLSQTKELYAVFFEKILNQSKGSVIITPYSFIGGKKFYPLRHLMNDYNGFVVSFDNVPGNIFSGKKHGIFNSNTSNSVRAAITVVENKKNINGFRFSPLIRFKNEERSKLLECKVLESFVDPFYQTVDEENQMFYKCDKRIVHIFKSWLNLSKRRLGDYVKERGKYTIYMPNTCRYFTSASNYKLKRNGQIELHFDDKAVFDYVYCLMNSSFAYWYWRLYDGGITYQKGLLLSMPMFFDLLTEDDKLFFKNIANEMINKTNDFIVKKNNIGIQENIKFPREYRDEINKRLLEILSIEDDASIFDIIHSNMGLEINI